MIERTSSGTRARLVTAMGELLRHQGYTATGVKQLTTVAQAPIGSLYHHFPEGKPQVAAEALATSGAAYRELFTVLMRDHPDPATAIEAAFAAAAEHIEQSGWITMCPVATVGGEVADSEPSLRAVAAEAVESWIDEGSRIFGDLGYSPPRARELAFGVVSGLEGGFLLARVLHSTEPLRAAGAAAAALARLP